MLVKSVDAKKHVEQLEECLNVLMKNRMKLNSTKCTFRVSSEKVLGFLITQKGIEVNQEQVRAFQNLPQPKSLKDIQKLIERVAVLGRFIFRSIDKCLPFYNLLKGNKKIHLGSRL